MNLLGLLSLLLMLGVQQNVARSMEEFEELKSSMVDIQNTVKTLVSEVQTMKAQYNDTSELEARVTILEEEVEELETSDSQQNDRLNNMDADISDNENDIEELVSDVNDLYDTSSNILLRLSDVEVENGLQSERISSLESSVDSLDIRVADVEEATMNITVIEAKVTALEELTSGMSADITELQETTEDFESRIQTLETQISESWDACLSSPCTNGGTCIDVNIDTFVCMCQDGYFGTTCSDSFQDTAFLVAFNQPSGGTQDPLIFNMVYMNPGGYYSSSTGMYTAPVDGVYQFSVHMAPFGGNTLFKMKIDNVENDGTHFDDYDNPSAAYRATTVLHHMSAGQTMHVAATGDGIDGSTYTLRTYFNGHLVYPD